MRSELVLTVGEKSKRFEKYTHPIVELDKSEDDESEELKSNNTKFGQSKSKKPHQPIASSCISFAPIPPESDSESENWWTIPIPETDRVEQECVLDPETGMMINLLIEDNKNNMENAEECFLDPETGLLTNQLGNDIGENIKSNTGFTLEPDGQDIENDNDEDIDMSIYTLSYKDSSAQEKIKNNEDENYKMYKSLPFPGKVNYSFLLFFRL
jgi:hypothetical protein